VPGPHGRALLPAATPLCEAHGSESRSGFPFRLVEASSRSCSSLIDSTMLRDAPLSALFRVSPRLAASAAPAAFCWAFDFAGIVLFPLRTSGATTRDPPRRCTAAAHAP
jgi:hypothetical protein